MSFVHLRTHSEFSVVDGMLRIDDAARAARADGQVALAITDLNNLFGAVQFYQACRGQGVKPIIGVDLWMEPEGSDKQPSRLLLLVQNMQGYLNLCELLARGWTRNAQRTQAWIKWSWLDELNEGLIALSGADGGVDRHGAAGRRCGARARRWRSALRSALRAASTSSCSAPAWPTTRPMSSAPWRWPRSCACRWWPRTRCSSSMPRTSRRTRRGCASPRARRWPTRGASSASRAEQYFKSQQQIEALFADVPSALANSLLIAQRCNLQLTLGKPQLPNFPIPDGMALEDYFRKVSVEGLEQRLAMRYPEAAERERQRPRYAERLEFEIVTILKMGFPGYFLIVSDFIKWAIANGCPVGPGRGSGAGSLVAYSLFITGLDPLQYNLLFERFLNPERVSMPDFDIDFCQANRERVIDYVKDKYGRDAVSQIATFGTMAAKAALRDVGRVLGMGYGHVDSIAKLVPAPPGKQVTLQRVPDKPDPGLIYARKEAPELEQREAAEEEVAELLSLAMRVEGLVRNVGMHAGGVLIAPGKITDFCPLYQQPGSDQRGEPVRQGRCRGHRPGEVRLPGPGHADHPGAGQGLHPRAPAGAAGLRLRARCRWTTRRSTSCSPKAGPRRCSSSKAAACRPCCARPGRTASRTCSR